MKEQKTTSLEKLIARYGELKLSASSTTSGSDKKIGAATLPALNNAIANFIAMESNHADDGELTDAQTVPCARLLVLWRQELPEFIRGEFENDLNAVLKQLGLNFGMVDGAILPSDNSSQEKEEQNG